MLALFLDRKSDDLIFSSLLSITQKFSLYPITAVFQPFLLTALTLSASRIFQFFSPSCLLQFLNSRLQIIQNKKCVHPSSPLPPSHKNHADSCTLIIPFVLRLILTSPTPWEVNLIAAKSINQSFFHPFFPLEEWKQYRPVSPKIRKWFHSLCLLLSNRVHSPSRTSKQQREAKQEEGTARSRTTYSVFKISSFQDPDKESYKTLI